MLSVHQCYLTNVLTDRKDRALPASAQIAQAEFLSTSRRSRRARNCPLQQSLNDVANDGIASRYASTVSVIFVFEPVTLKN